MSYLNGLMAGMYLGMLLVWVVYSFDTWLSKLYILSAIEEITQDVWRGVVVIAGLILLFITITNTVLYFSRG